MFLGKLFTSLPTALVMIIFEDRFATETSKVIFNGKHSFLKIQFYNLVILF